MVLEARYVFDIKIEIDLHIDGVGRGGGDGFE